MSSVSLILFLSWHAIFIKEIGLAVAEEECSSNADCHANCHCASHEYCCKRGNYPNVCRRSCVGEECAENTDCGGPHEHCDSNKKCKNRERSSSLSGGKITRIVISVLSSLIAVSLCILLWRCYKKRRHRDRTNRYHATMVTTIAPGQQRTCCPYDPTRQPPQSPVNRHSQQGGLMPLPYHQRPASISQTPSRKVRKGAFYIPPENVNNPEREWSTARNPVLQGNNTRQTHTYPSSLQAHRLVQISSPSIQSYTSASPPSEADSDFAADVTESYINHLNIIPEAYPTGPLSSP
ncbi:Hypothetical predicted protein [Paramuricea clavata]|uniref:Uncharacterized protein n=1 Tax=Paramuricea clavata TaxID=317549 RepID=A0A6S7L1A5_PARCT|nr:Hypothetical predicted protein [Paramuricea clavata]